jgi:ferrous iron transport protein B
MATVKPQEVTSGIFGQIYQRFDGKIGAFAYLLFVLLYLPCVSTVAAMARELNKKWACFAIIWATGLAYTVATGFYQAATFNRHPLSSSVWLAGIVLSYIIGIGCLRYLSCTRD